MTAVGEGVELFAVGDEVLGTPARGLGAFAEHTVLDASAPATATALGGSGRERAAGVLEKTTGVVAYGLVDPNVVATFPLDRVAEAMALVESGHSAGEVVIVP